MKSIVLLSGGIDSAVMLAEQVEESDCYCITLDYHQRSEHAEIKAAKSIARLLHAIEHRVVTLDLRSMLKSSLTGERSLTIRTLAELREFDISPEYVPARNTIMLSLALGWADSIGAEQVLIGCTKEDRLFPDCSLRYIQSMNQVAQTGTRVKPRIIAPYIHCLKHELISLAVSIGAEGLLRESISCYQAKGLRHCGRCAACQYRIEAFEKAGVVDTTEYIAPL